MAARLDDRKVPSQLPVTISTTLHITLMVCLYVVLFFFVIDLTHAGEINLNLKLRAAEATMILTSSTVLFQDCNVGYSKIRPQRAAQYQLVQRDLLQKSPGTIITNQSHNGFEYNSIPISTVTVHNTRNFMTKSIQLMPKPTTLTIAIPNFNYIYKIKNVTVNKKLKLENEEDFAEDIAKATVGSLWIQ